MRLPREILKSLNAPSVQVVSQDSFYKSLTPEQSKRVHLQIESVSQALTDCLNRLSKMNMISMRRLLSTGIRFKTASLSLKAERL